MALAFAACEGGEPTSSTPDPGPHLGVYSLRTINGDTLPIVTTEAAGVTTIYGGEFELTRGGAFRALTDTGFRDAGGSRRDPSGLHRPNSKFNIENSKLTPGATEK